MLKLVDVCGVEGKRRLCDLNVTSSSPALATKYSSVLLVNSPNKLNLLSWLLIYLYFFCFFTRKILFEKSSKPTATLIYTDNII